MNLYIVRHGIAVSLISPDVKGDEERWLTDRGKERMGEIAKGLKALGVKPDLLLSSPLVRAKQTAEILAKTLGCKERLQVTEALSPGFSITELCEVILEAGTPDNVMIVGHEPDLSELISMMVWGEDHGEVMMKKGGVALLSFGSLPPGEQGVVLQWLIPPKVLRRVGQ